MKGMDYQSTFGCQKAYTFRFNGIDASILDTQAYQVQMALVC